MLNVNKKSHMMGHIITLRYLALQKVVFLEKPQIGALSPQLHKLD